MVLKKSAIIPEDAVRLDEYEAVSYVWQFVFDWKQLSDTWALKYAPVMLGAINAVSGIIINRHFRNRLKLGTYGFFSSVIPISMMPGVLTPLFHRQFISTKILLMQGEACPVCYELRSSALQLSLGVAYPMLLGPAASIMLANRYSTARMPHLMEGPRVLFEFIRKLSRPLTGTLAILAGVQVASSAILTYYEFKNYLSLQAKFAEVEKKLETREVNG